MHAPRRSSGNALRTLVGVDPANIDFAALLQWLRERDEPEVLAAWLAELSSSPTSYLRQFVAQHARTWTIGLATAVFREPNMLHDLLERLPPKHPFKVALLERTVDLMRGIKRPDEYDLMLFALTSRRLRRDFRRLNRYVRDRAFPLFVPEPGTPPFALDLEQLKAYIKRDYSADRLAKTFTLPLALDSAEAARLQIARRAPELSDALVSALVDSQSACDQLFRRIELAPYLTAAALRVAREYMENDPVGRSPTRVHLLTRAVDAGLLTDRSVLEYARTVAPGIDSAQSPIPLILRFSRLSDESRRRLVESRQYVMVGEQGNRETAWSDAMAVVSSQFLTPTEALALTERVLRDDLKRRAARVGLQRAVESLPPGKLHPNVTYKPLPVIFLITCERIDADTRATIQHLWEPQTLTPSAGAVPIHRQLLLALINRVDGDLRAKLVRRWLWLEPEAVCSMVESGLVVELPREDVLAAVRWSLAQGDARVSEVFTAIFERHPDWVPTPTDVARDAARWATANESEVRAFALNLHEWMALEAPRFRARRDL